MGVRSLGKTKRSWRPEGVRDGFLGWRRFACGGEAVHKVYEKGKAGFEKQIPPAAQAKEGQTEGRRRQMTRVINVRRSLCGFSQRSQGTGRQRFTEQAPRLPERSNDGDAIQRELQALNRCLGS